MDFNREHNDVLVFHIPKHLANDGSIAIDFIGARINSSESSTFLKGLTGIRAYSVEGGPNICLLGRNAVVPPCLLGRLPSCPSVVKLSHGVGCVS